MEATTSRQVQSQTQQQVQTLSPQQIMVVKLLELPTVELEDRVRAELLENPALEEGEAAADTSEESNTDSEAGEEAEHDAGEAGEVADSTYDADDDYLTEDDIPPYKLQEHNRSRGEQAEEIPFSDTTSFYEALKEQLAELDLTQRRRELAEYLIGSLDDDGLLRKSLEAISDELAIYANIDASPRELEDVLTQVIQGQLDPPGLGARNLQECLLIQVGRRGHGSTEERILSECYEEFTRKHWDKIKQKLGLTDEEFDRAHSEILRLNPRPGASMGEVIGRNMQQIVPDFIVETYDDGTINLTLNSRGVPNLRMSRDFTEMMKEHSRTPQAKQSRAAREAMLFLKQKMDAAQGFISALKQRQQTLMTTMQAIIDLQRPFFQTGDESQLRPMKLKDVAERTGLDISTISRVGSSKYVQTNFGIYPLKYFFNESYTTDEGEELSTRLIRRTLREIIDSEDKQKPYTDEVLTEMLNARGYPVARRTVAKYREQLGLPVARLRR
jgi:RNA polymerase sigma-54 factor